VNRLPIFTDVMRGRGLALAIWALALGAVSAMYIAFWPLMKGEEMLQLLEGMPEALVQAMGYDRIASPGGYITSTVYGLIGPVLLLVFGVGAGAGLIAGSEEDGTLELELTGPVSRSQIYGQRLLALAASVTSLVAVVGLVTLALVAILDMGVPTSHVAAGCLGLLLFVFALATVAFAGGAAMGRRGLTLGVAAALAVASFMLNAIGPVVDMGWMTAISPWSWYLAKSPLETGFDWAGLGKLAAIPVIAGLLGLKRFLGRDLMV
jgi:ABC-2 type transport system permease protein